MFSSTSLVSTLKSSRRTSSTKTQDQIIRPFCLLTNPQLQKVIKDLQDIAKTQQQKRTNLQQQLQTLKRRSHERQIQFLGIIEKYRKQQLILLEANPQIDNLYKRIVNNFDQFNEKTAQIIESKYGQSMSIMNRRIKQIMMVVEQEMTKLLRAVKKSPANLQVELKNLCEAASEIEGKNYEVMETLKKLDYENKILKSQREFIIEDAVSKNIKISKLNEQIKLLKKQLAAITEENIKLLNSEHIIKSVRKRNQPGLSIAIEKLSSQIRISQPKKLRSSRSNMSSCQQSAASSYQFKNIDQILNEKNLKVSSPIKHKMNTPRYRKNESLLVNQSNKRASSFFTNQIKNSPQDPTTLKKQNPQQGSNQLKLKTRRTKILEPDTQISVDEDRKLREYSYIRTIQNLQKTLKREKTKSNNLGSIITQLNNRIKEMNQLLQQIIGEWQKIDNKGVSQNLYKKLVETFTILKQKIMIKDNINYTNFKIDDSLICI